MSTHTASDRRLLSKTMFAKPLVSGDKTLAQKMVKAEVVRRFGDKFKKK